MKRETIPTAPLERVKWHEHLSKQPRRSSWLILSMLLSLAAGGVGALAVQVYQWEGLATLTPNIVVVPEQSSSEQAKFLQTLSDQQAQAVVTIKDGSEARGVGVVVSSDGWIVTSGQVASTLSDDLSVTTVTGKTYTVDQVVEDEYSGLSYVHVPSSGLRPAEFREQPVLLGEAVVAYTPTQVAFASIGQNQAELVSPRRTNTLSVAYRTDRALLSAMGTPVYDFSGAVMGLLIDETTIIPISVVNEVVFGLFSEQAIQRPELSISYIQTNTGATVLSSLQPEVNVDDIITAVNDTALTAANDLSDVIAQFDLGDTVTFTIKRDGVMTTQQFVLD